MNIHHYICCSDYCGDTFCKSCGYFGVQFMRYGVYFIIAGISVNIYGNEDNKSDYNIKSYEYYAILILYLCKLILQIAYLNGPKYDSNKHIKNILKEKFGYNVASIIIDFLFLNKETREPTHWDSDTNWIDTNFKV